jgi:hypothetical protein
VVPLKAPEDQIQTDTGCDGHYQGQYSEDFEALY